GEVKDAIVVHCGEVSRINSTGVKAWIMFFRSLQQKGVKIKFSHCSTAIIEQMNMVNGFMAGGTVESVYAPFLCHGCQSEVSALYSSEQLRKSAFQVADLKCPKCGEKATFDDVPEEYFGFLNRT